MRAKCIKTSFRERNYIDIVISGCLNDIQGLIYE